MIMDGRTITINGDAVNPDLLMAPQSPFRSYDGQNFGSNTTRAFLGVNSEKNPGDAAQGAKIKAVTKGSAAEKAGLREGDVITKVDEITVSGPEDLVKAVHKYKPEDKITLTYLRAGKSQKTTATLGKTMARYNFNYNYTMPKSQDFNFSMPNMPDMPDGENPPQIFSWNDGKPKLGIKAQDTEDGKGVKVLDVDDDSPADKAGVKEDDIITRFDGKDVDSAPTLADLARDAKGKPVVKIDLIRDGKPMELEIKTPKKLKTADL
jgi:serine protease Do